MGKGEGEGGMGEGGVEGGGGRERRIESSVLHRSDVSACQHLPTR